MKLVNDSFEIVEHVLVALSQPDMLEAPLREPMMSFIGDISHLGIAKTELDHALNDSMHSDTVKAAQVLWPDTKGQQMLLEVTLADALMSEAKTATSEAQAFVDSAVLKMLEVVD